MSDEEGDLRNVDDDDQQPLFEDEEEESLIRYYFDKGFEYNDILRFLEKYHNHTISYRTLLRRCKKYGMKRRNRAGIPQITHERVRQMIQEMINGPGSAGGYRTVWHYLELEGLRVPRAVVQSILKHLDPEETENRRCGPKLRVAYRRI